MFNRDYANISKEILEYSGRIGAPHNLHSATTSINICKIYDAREKTAEVIHIMKSNIQ